MNFIILQNQVKLKYKKILNQVYNQLNQILKRNMVQVKNLNDLLKITNKNNKEKRI